MFANHINQEVIFVVTAATAGHRKLSYLMASICFGSITQHVNQQNCANDENHINHANRTNHENHRHLTPRIGCINSTCKIVDPSVNNGPFYLVFPLIGDH